MTMNRALHILTELLYPRRCPVCHRPAPYGKDICPGCLSVLPYVRRPRCRVCGKPVPEGMTLCADCMAVKHAYVAAAAAFVYDDILKESVAGLKYRGRREYGSALGKLLFAATKDRLRLWKIEAVIPVPVHEKKRRSRGYNQAELLAGPVAAGLGVPLLARGLIRTENTKAMKKLSAEERRRNLRGAFAPGPDLASFRRVLIVDDIYTTGSTIDACAEVLTQAGIPEVYAACLAIGVSTQIT